jgi:hypothetical protein
MKDGLLKVLIEIAEGMEQSEDQLGSQTITLYVSGAMISGELITYKAYLKEFYGGAIQRALDQLKESDKVPAPEPTGDDFPDYIHLQSVKVWLAGNPLNVICCPLWRGKIESVDGFTLGAPEIPNS